MVVLNVFSTYVKYDYKTKLCTLTSFVILCALVIVFFGPIFFIRNSGGFWYRSRMYMEIPEVTFTHKYLLLMEPEFNSTPIVCTSFGHYKENEIRDECVVTKVREVDKNNDGRKDLLKFQVEFFTDKPIRSLKLLLFFHYNLKTVIKATFDTLGVLDYTFHHDVQKINIITDLYLQQRGLLRLDRSYDTQNDTNQLENGIPEILSDYSTRKVAARISDPKVTWSTGFSKDHRVSINAEIFYLESFIHYQPDIWEELKWAWIQYLSFFVLFVYFMKKLLGSLFSKRYLKSYVVVPWKEHEK